MIEPYYSHAGIQIFNADCLEAMAALPPASIDAVITDPPYGTTACAWDSPIPFAPMWAALKRLIKPRAPIVLFGSQPFTSALVMSNPAWFRYELIWDKIQTGAPGVVEFRPLPTHENLLIFSPSSTVYNPMTYPGEPYKATTRNGGNRHGFGFKGKYYQANNSGFRYQTSIIRRPKERHPYHETQKPTALLTDLITMYTDPGACVLDFTCGSGTTLRAAKNLGRRAIGIEIEERYCDIAARRLSQEVMALEEVA